MLGTDPVTDEGGENLRQVGVIACEEPCLVFGDGVGSLPVAAPPNFVEVVVVVVVVVRVVGIIGFKELPREDIVEEPFPPKIPTPIPSIEKDVPGVRRAVCRAPTDLTRYQIRQSQAQLQAGRASILGVEISIVAIVGVAGEVVVAVKTGVPSVENEKKRIPSKSSVNALTPNSFPCNATRPPLETLPPPTSQRTRPIQPESPHEPPQRFALQMRQQHITMGLEESKDVGPLLVDIGPLLCLLPSRISSILFAVFRNKESRNSIS